MNLKYMETQRGRFIGNRPLLFLTASTITRETSGFTFRPLAEKAKARQCFKIERSAGCKAPGLFPKNRLMNRYLFGFTCFRLGNIEFQDAVFKVGFDFVRLDIRRQCKRSLKPAVRSLSAIVIVVFHFVIS